MKDGTFEMDARTWAAYEIWHAAQNEVVKFARTIAGHGAITPVRMMELNALLVCEAKAHALAGLASFHTRREPEVNAVDPRPTPVLP